MKRNAFKLVLFVIVLGILFIPLLSHSLAHSGGTDEEGGHNSPDGYHYHHGYPAHQHPNGVCPYDYDDNVDHSERSGGTATPDPDESSFLSTTIQVLLFLVVVFLSFVLPSIIAVRLGKDSSSIGCFCWILFLVLLAVYAYCLTADIFGI